LSTNRVALLLTGIASEGQAILAAQKVLRKLRLPFKFGDSSVSADAKVGLAVADASFVPGNKLIRCAEEALASARQRDTDYEVAALHDAESSQTQSARFDIRGALDRNEILMFFQPVVNLMNNHMVGAESLVRWNNPKHGIITPGFFLPGVENTADMLRLTEFAITACCRALAAWQSAGKEIWVSVNVTANDLQHDDFLQLLQDSAAVWDVDLSFMVLEITESVLLKDPANCSVLLAKLNEMGVSVAIDDFGTGYSSLAYLRDLKADKLKVDRSFILNIETNETDRQILESIVQLAHAVNMQVVAEGIENMTVAQHAHRLGCDFGQGFIFGRPSQSLPDIPTEKSVANLHF